MYSDFDDDEHGILKAVHDYAVSKGFVPDDTLDINAGYRGRPNLDDLSASQVKDTLIYHVDRIFNLYGPAHFRVVFWNYQGKIEYIFLWR